MTEVPPWLGDLGEFLTPAVPNPEGARDGVDDLPRRRRHSKRRVPPFEAGNCTLHLSARETPRRITHREAMTRTGVPTPTTMAMTRNKSRKKARKSKREKMHGWMKIDEWMNDR